MLESLQTLIQRGMRWLLPRLRGVHSDTRTGVDWSAIGITSALFALMHPPWSLPIIFLLAICLGYAYQRTGNLWVCITMHALFNTSMTAVFLLSGSSH